MLKIKDNVDLKELGKFGIFPVYECAERTGETRIRALETEFYRFEKLCFKKKKKRIANLFTKDIYENPIEYVLKINNDIDNLIDLDILYELIKADLVEKV